jgi:hypothetical protein
MRAIPILVSCLVASTAYAGGESTSVSNDESKTLTAAEVNHYIQPYRNEIRSCYLTSASGGTLALDMIIHRDGSVFHLAVVTTNLAPRAARRIDRCIRRLSARWHFPVRRGFTTVTVPFNFVKTVAPGAGPQRGCTRRRGCRV